MGGITAPVDGSGSQPAWIARVSNPDFSRCSWLILRAYPPQPRSRHTVEEVALRPVSKPPQRRHPRNHRWSSLSRPAQRGLAADRADISTSSMSVAPAPARASEASRRLLRNLLGHRWLRRAPCARLEAS